MSSTLTKDELINDLATKTGLTVSVAHTVVHTMLYTIQQALVNNRKVEFRGFGIFRAVVRKARQGRNPRIPDMKYEVPARTVVKFRIGSGLDAALNPPAPAEPPVAPLAVPMPTSNR